jgi:hypothetical protein
MKSLDAGIDEPLVQDVPISTPVPKTKAPRTATRVAANMIGVSM